jgi:hypothetical protein
VIGKLFAGLDLGQRFHPVAVISPATALAIDRFRIERAGSKKEGG